MVEKNDVLTLEDQLRMAEEFIAYRITKINFYRPVVIPIGGEAVVVQIGRRASRKYSLSGNVVSACPCSIEACACGTVAEPVQIKIGIYSDDPYAFRNLPAKFLEMADVEEEKTYSGLLAKMRRVHGPEFNEDEIVTVYVYKRLE